METEYLKTEQQENEDVIYQDKFDEALSEFEYRNNIELKEGTQQNWNAFLMFAKRYLAGCMILKNKDASYNLDIVGEWLQLYIEKCMIYDKEVSVIGFSLLTGISSDIIYQWGSENTKYNNGKNKLNSRGSEIYQKLRGFREESLSNKLQNKGVNQIGILAILNHSYQWNMPGVKESRSDKALVSRSDLNKLESSDTVPELPVVGD